MILAFNIGIEVKALILSTLEQSEEKVVMFLVGSCRYFVVAFNRNPDYNAIMPSVLAGILEAL